MDKDDRLTQRFFEILIPLLTWLTITMPVWLSPFHPAIVAYFVIVFDVYFFYKTLKTVTMATLSYMNINKAKKIDWLKAAKANKDFAKIKHFIIISNFRETAAKLGKTIQALAKQNYPAKNIYVVLAMEEAEGAIAKKRGRELTKRFAKSFGGFYVNFHKLTTGEVKGKASNEASAARFISKKAKELGFDAKNILVTSCDADSILDKNYCAYLTALYLQDSEGKYRFYWAPVLLYNNYWKLNFFIRIQTTISSIVRLAFLSEKYNLIQISTYSMSLWLLEEVGYWDVNIIPEDWHIFLQAFFKFGSKVQTKPIYLITTRDGVRGRGFIDTFRTRYEQEKRWAWGVSDIPYAFKQSLSAHHIPFFERLFRLLGLLETHMLWPTSFFLLTLGATLPILINPNFKRTVLGYLLPQIAGGILTLTTLFVLAIGYLDYLAKHKLLKKSEAKKVPLLLMQWILFPVLSPVLSALLSSFPALESATRLLFGRKIDYKVTRKI